MLLKLKPFSSFLDWTFVDPDTGYKYSAPTRERLVQLIVQYRANNGLEPIESLDFVLENYLCSQPENVGKCRPAGPLKRGFMAYLKGGMTLVTNLWYDKTVSQEVADSRAAICLRCPLNVFPDKGAFVSWSDSIAEASVGDKKARGYDKLGTCAGCSCTLKAKVWYPGPFKLTENERMAMSAIKECWQLNEK